jgi:hypothetical protein
MAGRDFEGHPNWTVAEDILLIFKRMTLGTEWKQFQMPERTWRACQSRMFRLCRSGDAERLWNDQLQSSLARFGLAEPPKVDWYRMRTDSGYCPEVLYKLELLEPPTWEDWYQLSPHGA